MPDQIGGSAPTRKADTDPFVDPDAPPSTPKQHEMGNESNTRAEDRLNPSEKLERDVKWGEIGMIAVQVALLVTTIIIAKIYYGQLEEMRKATDAATKSADAA